MNLIAFLSLLGLAATGEGPGVAGVPVFVAGTHGYAGYRIPAIEVAPDGTVLAFAEARKNGLGDPGEPGQEIDLVLRRSVDGGATWSDLEVIEAPGAMGSSANPATVVDRSNGRVWLLYLRCGPGRSSTTARPGTDDTKALARASDDNGKTWSEPIDLTSVARDGADPKWRISVMGPGGMIQTRDGRLIAPFWKYEPFGNFAIWSDDHGKTWHRGGFVPGGTGDEDQLVELADGRVLMDFRQSSGERRWRSISDDGGRTWGERRPGEAVTPVCCAIERYRDRLIWTGPKGPERRNLVVRISDDDGATFPVERLIAHGFAAYSDLAVLKDGDVGVLWESGVERGYQAITFTRLTRAFLDAPAPAP